MAQPCSNISNREIKARCNWLEMGDRALYFDSEAVTLTFKSQMYQYITEIASALGYMQPPHLQNCLLRKHDPTANPIPYSQPNAIAQQIMYGRILAGAVGQGSPRPYTRPEAKKEISELYSGVGCAEVLA
jgi:hypothetical protein